MFGKTFVRELIIRSAQDGPDRRRFLSAAGLAGLGVVASGAVAGAASSASAATKDPADAATDAAVLNFALNLEYLEAQFYAYAATGYGLPSNLLTGTATQGGVTGGKKVPFKSRAVREIALEIASDERKHVAFLRGALSSAAVSQPAINIRSSFTAAARAAGLIGPTQTFDPYANENNFLLAAFIFEDVGVTAYKGAAPLIDNKTYLEAAAGILAVEAYHAGTIRTLLYERGLGAATNKISNARDSLDGTGDRDQGVLRGAGSAGGVMANITPTDGNAIAQSRTTGQVLNVVYPNPAAVDRGGFFPAGVNGAINTSSGA